MPARSEALVMVHDQLQAYARRGVFRSFSQTRAGDGQAEFCFCWLWNLPFRLWFDGKRKAISFKNLLPGVPKGSELNRELKSFIRDLSAKAQPAHRRLDPKRLSIRYSNRRGNVTITFVVAKDQYDYGVKTALNSISEMFIGFLNLHFPEYLVQHFRRPED